MRDVVIGTVIDVVDGNTINVHVSHIGRHNKYGYRNYETIRLPFPKSVQHPYTFTGRQQKIKLLNRYKDNLVRCQINYRNEYDILIADVEIL